MTDKFSETTYSSPQRQTALARWDNEGGAGPDGPHQQGEAGGACWDKTTPTDVELAHLRIRVMALENLIVTLLANAADGQRDRARDMAINIDQSAASTRYPPTTTVATGMFDLIEQAEHLRAAQDP